MPLYSYLESSYPTELVAYAGHDGGSWRQDLVHAQDVALLGAALLSARTSTWWGKELTLAEAICRAPGAARRHLASVPELHANWFLAALLHDVGIAPQVALRVLKDLGEGDQGVVRKLLEPASKAIKAKAEELAEEAQADKTLMPPAEKAPATDHGLMARQRVYALLSDLRPDAKTELLRHFAPALDAIAAHNLKQPMDGTRSPISCLLVLCDTLQDWDRPRLDRELLAQVVIGLLREPRGRLRDVSALASHVPDACLELEAAGFRDGNLHLRSSPLRVRLSADSTGGDAYQPVTGWVDVTERFQSTVLPSGFPEVELTIQHTYDSRHGRPGVWDLWEFCVVQEAKWGHILAWLEAIRGGADRRVRYEETKLAGSPAESFTIRITHDPLPRPLLVSRSSGDLFGDYREWVRSRRALD